MTCEEVGCPKCCPPTLAELRAEWERAYDARALPRGTAVKLAPDHCGGERPHDWRDVTAEDARFLFWACGACRATESPGQRDERKELAAKREAWRQPQEKRCEGCDATTIRPARAQLYARWCCALCGARGRRRIERGDATPQTGGKHARQCAAVRP
jgi:hypothetical protein